MEKGQQKRLRYIVMRLAKLKEEAALMKANAANGRDTIRAGSDPENKHNLVEQLGYSRSRLAEIKAEIQLMKEERKVLLASK